MAEYFAQYYEDKTDLDQVPSLLDYVYDTVDDISDKPSEAEYHKLKRIMRIMVRFYEKGSSVKYEQWKATEQEFEKLKTDISMVKDQLAVLEQFPPIHPKRRAYEDSLNEELERLEKQVPLFEKKIEEYRELHEWSRNIVAAVRWMESNIEDYVNNNLKEIKVKAKVQEPLTAEQIKTHLRGLEEITYNLQESQDFFEASLDGRLRRFHQIEKCMIKGMLQAIRKYPEDNPRRKHVEEELKKDLEYVEENMKEDPKRIQHKERMRAMHRDFFQVLRWQRRKLKALVGIVETEEHEQEGQSNGNGNSFASCPATCPMGGV